MCTLCILYIVIDALLPSDDDLMNNDSFTFQRGMRGRNNAPLPGIRIPSSVVQNRGMKNGGGKEGKGGKGGGKCYEVWTNLCNYQYLTAAGRRGTIPVVNIFILNLESKLQNDEGYAYSISNHSLGLSD